MAHQSFWHRSFPRAECSRRRQAIAVPRAFLDFDELCFEVEAYKRDRSWYNLNASPAGIRDLLADPNWYDLRLPQTHVTPTDFNGIRLLQEVAKELVKRYCEHLYNCRKREFLEPRLEIRDLDRNDDNLPQDEFYQLIVDGDTSTVIEAIERVKKDIEENKDELDDEIRIPGKSLFPSMTEG